ncbi:MAG: SurA N-terminal domain-containing protein [Gallionellaceae bacterium]
MFDFVQEKKRLVQIVLALIILPFAFWGVDSYQKSGGGEALASVNGIKISSQEFETALRQQQQKMREMAGPAFDQSIFDKPEIKHSILEGLVTMHLMQSQAHKTGLVVSDEQLASVILGIGAFQTDGKFDKDKFKVEVASNNMDPLTFEARLRQDLTARQLTDAYTQNGYASQSAVDNLIRLNEQQRVVATVNFSAENFISKVKISDVAVDEYYKNNQREFQTSERVKVEYVTFSADSLSSHVSVAEAEIKKYFEEHVAEFATQEQRQAAHILIAAPATASSDEKAVAKTKAEQILQQVKKAPTNFAALAKQYSQDPGSAANGGDLGLFGRGMLVKPFEDAAYSLKVGEISGLVQSNFGFHIIKLSAIKSAKGQSLDEVKEIITQRIKAQKASDQFAELAEKFGNTVYEQSDSLKPAAELVKATVQPAVWLTKGQAPSGIWTEKALQTAFSEDAIKNKRNTSPVEIAPNTLLAARAVEYQAASVRTLQEVSAAIRNQLERKQAFELVEKHGSELLDRLQKGEKVDVSWSATKSISREASSVQRAGVELELAKQVFKASPGKLPAYVGVKSAQGYMLARVDAVTEIASIDEAKRSRYMQQIAQITGEALLSAYLQEAKKNADISIKAFAPEEKK